MTALAARAELIKRGQVERAEQRTVVAVLERVEVDEPRDEHGLCVVQRSLHADLEAATIDAGVVDLTPVAHGLIEHDAA